MQESPRIVRQSWGVIELAELGRFGDVKLFPGRAKEWDWRETGTHHVPGIQIADCEELLSGGATTLVLSRGVARRLQVPAATVEWLERRGVSVEVLPTPEAVVKYEELRRSGVPIGALLHSTC